MGINPKDRLHNLKRVELDDLGRISAIEFHECNIFLDKAHATALREFVDDFNRPEPKLRVREVEATQ